MTYRLARHWPTLWARLGLNPWRADEWLLDEALVAEVFVEELEREQYRQRARLRRKGRA